MHQKKSKKNPPVLEVIKNDTCPINRRVGPSLAAANLAWLSSLERSIIRRISQLKDLHHHKVQVKQAVVNEISADANVLARSLTVATTLISLPALGSKY